MDITFHYFAVKTLARLAGFPEREAQTIAEISQYVDDYAAYAYQRHSNVPDDLKTAPYDVYMPGQDGGKNTGYNFNPSTTGFASIFDYSVLTIANNQKNYVLPFHFLPTDAASVASGGNTQEAHWHSGGEPQNTLITQEMELAAQGYALAGSPDLSLIQIGMLLHIYADTCAHAGFSGYAKESNEVELVHAYENITGENKDIRSRFNEKIMQAQTGWAAKTIAIGHGFAGEAPDCTFVTWQIRRKKTGQLEPEVNNTTRFVEKSREILDYLRSVRGLPPIDDNTWIPIQANIKKAFLYDPASRAKGQTLIDALEKHWTNCFKDDVNVPGITYHYDAAQIFGSQVLTTGLTAVNLPEPMRTRFYGFVRFAQDHLINLYGPRPRSGKAGLPQLAFRCDKIGENGEASYAAPLETVKEGIVAMGDPVAGYTTDLQDFMKFNNGGCVFEIRVLKQESSMFQWIIWVDAQGPSLFGGSGHLTFTDASGAKYRLSIFRSARCSHTLRYNSEKPVICKIEWSN